MFTLTRSRHRAVIGSAALASIAMTVAILPAQAAQAPGATPGSSGIGDSYFPRDGNGGYNVGHYAIHDTYRLKSGRLTGWTDITAVAKKSLSSFSLDLLLNADRVTINGRPTAYAKPSKHELRITPGKPIGKGKTFTVRVGYHGTPAQLRYAGESGWIHSDTEAMAMNEPHIAPYWFPANDHPRDKATFDITVRVPRGNQLISNGELIAKKHTSKWSAWHWRMSDPMAPYLAFFAAGRFAVDSGTSHGLPYTNAVSKALPKSWQRRAMRLMRRSPAIVRWLETQYGPYPFTSTGGVTTMLFSGFALENQSRPTYPYMGDGPSAVSTVVDELAHQWFGDDVSVNRWRDIWLNEGFASFAEWRYTETHGGPNAQARLVRRWRAHGPHASLWQQNIARPGPRHIFDSQVYDRGAMALQALRHRIGSSAFDATLRTWVRRHAGSTARVGQFEALAERISGHDLNGFFHAWLRSGTKPKRTVANGLK